jgi:DNA (cytosine-5)-methyltransferase 1
MASVIDLFAGWGGFSLGAERAGAKVLVAANHWPLAVEAHALNHPKTHHLCQDLRQANFHELPDFDLLTASPACQGHSSAARPSRKRGEIASKHDELRATAWAVTDCLEAKRPKAAIIENVLDFKEWSLYPVWKMALERLGYSLAEHVATATDFGVPQRRDRLVIVATRSKSPLKLTLPSRSEPAFASCIDWEDAHVDPRERGWKPVASKPVAVRNRVAKARRLGLGDVFLSQYTSDHSGVSLDEPIRTLTTKSQWAIVRGDEMRMLRVREIARGMGFPDDYRWPEHASKEACIKGLGNAIVPQVAQWFTERVMEAA